MKTKKKRELTLRILPRRNPLVDELAWKHGSWCITPKWNKLKMDNLSKVMYKTYIKPVWFFFWENITIVSGEHCFVYLQIDILHRMNLKHYDNATGLIDQILLFFAKWC